MRSSGHSVLIGVLIAVVALSITAVWFLLPDRDGTPTKAAFRLGVGALDTFEAMSHRLLPEPLQIAELVTGFWKFRIMEAFARLRVPDVLAAHAAQPGATDGLTCAQIAERIRTFPDHPSEVHEAHLCRLLFAASHLRFMHVREGDLSALQANDTSLNEHSVRRYTLTSLGRQLVTADNSMRAFVLMMGEASQGAWANLERAVRTGRSGWELAHGALVWDYFAQHPEESVLFNMAMTSLTEALPAGPAVARDYPHWSQCRRVCDLGGGRGQLALALLQEHAHLTGVVLDLPGVVAEAEQYLRQHGVFPERAQVLAADFFRPETMPADTCDCVTLKMVLHDWPDADAVRILRSAQHLLPRERPGRILVVDGLLQGPGNSLSRQTALMDMNMLASCPPGARERTRRDFAQVFAAAGLNMTAVYDTRTPFYVVEGIPGSA